MRWWVAIICFALLVSLCYASEIYVGPANTIADIESIEDGLVMVPVYVRFDSPVSSFVIRKRQGVVVLYDKEARMLSFLKER